MKPGTLLITAIIFGIALLSACKKDPKVNPPDPNKSFAMEGKSAEIFPDGGVALKGTINKVPDSLKSFGFIIATDSLLQSNQMFVRATGPAAVGDFTVSANTGLVNNKKYYYSPFYSVYPTPTTWGNYTSYVTYNVKSFISGGSKNAKIDTIYPLQGVMGDTVTIKGKYFSNTGVNVAIGGKVAGFVPNSVSDSVMKVIVPSDLNTIISPIALRMNGADFATNRSFTLYTPVITSYTQNATFRDTISIIGDHFGVANSLNKVTFGTVDATVVSSSKKKLRVIVPDGLLSINSDIILNAQLQKITAPGKFRVARPVITSVNATAKTGDMITVVGKYFHPLVEKTTLLFENVNSTLYSVSTSQIKATLPPGPFPRRKAQVKLQFLDTAVTYSQDIQVKDTWIMASASVPFMPSTAVGSFTINNVSYVVAPLYDVLGAHTNYLWKFNPADYSWQRFDIPFSFGGGKMTYTATKAYLYTGDIVNNFWEYDPSTNTWKQKATYTAGSRSAGTMFTIGGKVYLGLGIQPNLTGGSSTPDNTFYQYDPATDTWSRKADYPAYLSVIGLVNGSSFVLGGKAYVFGSATIQNYNLVYVYNPSTDAWEKQTSVFNSNSQGHNAFVYNGYGYVAGNLSYSFPATSTYRSCFKYSSGTDTWVQLPDDVGNVSPLGEINPGFVFVLNGNIYVGDGQGYGNYIFVASGSSL